MVKIPSQLFLLFTLLRIINFFVWACKIWYISEWWTPSTYLIFIELYLVYFIYTNDIICVNKIPLIYNLLLLLSVPIWILVTYIKIIFTFVILKFFIIIRTTKLVIPSFLFPWYNVIFRLALSAVVIIYVFIIWIVICFFIMPFTALIIFLWIIQIYWTLNNLSIFVAGMLYITKFW